MTESNNEGQHAAASLEAWGLWQSMIADLTQVVRDDAETELELLDGLQVLARCTTLATELNVDSDPELPFFFTMDTEMRYIGGPSPDGDYDLCILEGGRAYRVQGHRNTSAYLGFQVLAGGGMEPRRMAAYLSDRDMEVAADGSFAFVIATERPADDVLGGAIFVEVPADAGSIVVRQYVADPGSEVLATYDIEPLELPGPPPVPTDGAVAARFTAAAWTIAKLVTLHKSPPMQEMIENPNRFFTYDPAALGAADTTPDNLYMLGTWRLAPDEALVIHAQPPEVRFWNLVIENIWHECLDVRRRQTSLTNGEAVLAEDGGVQFVLSAADPGAPNWLDTAGRHRGFMLFRWLDDPAPPMVTAEVVALADLPN
jgi:hypothetical protein